MDKKRMLERASVFFRVAKAVPKKEAKPAFYLRHAKKLISGFVFKYLIFIGFYFRNGDLRNFP
jgi:hypothetical protein